MPPESPLSEEQDSADESFPLTDENVAILHQIIKAAEQYPDVQTLPFRAIFAAYESVLPENGLDPDHDQIYLRFLFRLGDRRQEGQSLYESFEGLLEELGFQIEYVLDEDGTQDTTNATGTEKDGYGSSPRVRDRSRAQRPSRRASFNSMYDAEDETTRAIGSRRASISGVEFSQRSIMDVRPSTRATTRRTEKTSSNASPPKLAPLQTKRRRLTAEEFANTLQHAQLSHRSVPYQGNKRAHQPNVPAGPELNVPTRASPSIKDISLAANDVGETFTGHPVTSHDSQPAYVVAQHERLYNPSRTQLLRDAETFHHYRIRSVAREIVDQWCDAALQYKEQHEHMERLAAAHDTKILLRQAFEHWRVRLHARKQAAQMERYFERQERRIARARDLMLLAKAFSHWEQCVREERIRATNARQHILRIKYFQAWKDVTLTNQRNVRLQLLRKSFAVWKQRFAQNLTGNIRADLLRQESLARDVYWHWFWTFCEMRSPRWRDGRLRRKCFSKWVSRFLRNRRAEQHVTKHSDNIARKKVFTIWMGNARRVLGEWRQAAAFNQQKKAGYALQALKRNQVYAPLARQVSNMVDWRVAGVTFATFVVRYRFEKQAEAVGRLRLLRNTWTHWNDSLRWLTLAHRIDDRYCLEALYTWVIAERFLLLRRLSEERLKQRFLYKMKGECTSRLSQRAHSYQLVKGSRRKASLQQLLARWHSKVDLNRHFERMASEFHAPKVTQDALQSWAQSLAHLYKLHGWANDARFYFSTKRMLKLWQTASVESRRQKRKNAYIQVRRKSKINLAGGVLQRWHGVSSHVHHMLQEASVVYQDHLLQVGTLLFDQWQAHWGLRREKDSQASQHYNRRLLERHLYTWIERLEEQARLEELADLNYEMRIKNVAFSWVNKLRLKIIEQKGQESNAENLRSWYEKRHVRNMLRQWQAQATKKLQPQEATALPSRLNRTRPRAVPDEGPTDRAENWTDFNIGDWIPALEAQSSTTPLPGYLSTPSKRAARAKALVRVSTTPAGTPFEQRLRSQIGSTPRTARRGGFGRSTAALRGSAFGAILEDSPRTPVARWEE